jgi:tol-pal system protein YbgF
MIKRSLFVAVLLASTAFPAAAQDIATRIFQMEERIRALTGQVEELNFTVQQLQKRVGQKTGAVEAPQPALRKQKIVVDAAEVVPDAVPQVGGIEVIEDSAGALASAKPKAKSAEVIGSASDGAFVAEGDGQPKLLGESDTAAAQPQDGGFQGEVLVPVEGEQQVAGAAVVTEGVQQEDGIEQVSLQPVDSPDVLYKTANEALLRRQFPEAETGFRNFLEKYPEHSLAGSAQFWLGETFYVQGDTRQAAQNFLAAYKKYPKSRRAPDSLLKLGMSLNKMGQKDQACAALNSVGTEFPRAVEAKKRATAEYKRAGC